MSTNCARQLLKITIAQIIQSFGFQSAQSITLDILNEILERYILMLCRSSREYAEIASRTEPTLDDVAAALDTYKISLNDLDEFISYIDIPQFAKDVVKFPNEKENKLGFVNDADNKELQDRIEDEDKEHIYYFYPLMERKEEPAPVPPPPPSINEQLDHNQVEIEMEQEKPAIILKNGVSYDTNMWESQYNPMSSMNKSFGGATDLTTRRKEPVAAQPKFPLFYHKPKSKTKKPTALKIESERDESSIDLDAKVNISADGTMTPLVQIDNKSLVDQMIDAVVTKYTAPQIMTTRRSSSPKFTDQLRQINDLQKPRSSTSLQTAGLSTSTSPVHNFIPEDVIDIVQPPQITLKIQRSSFEKTASPIKKREKKKDALKIVINKKMVLNNSSEISTSNNNSITEVVNITEEVVKEDEVKVIENESVIPFDSDEDNFAEFDDGVAAADKQEPIIWRPTCNLKQTTITTTEATLVSITASRQESIESHNLETSITSPTKIASLTEETLISNIKLETDIIGEIPPTGEKVKHKKRKKDKEHKKHKKDKHEKRKHKHKTDANSNEVKPKLEIDIKIEENEEEVPKTIQTQKVENQDDLRHVPKLKLKLGGNQTNQTISQESENVDMLLGQASSSTHISPLVPKLLIKPIMKPPVSEKKTKSLKKMQPLKITLKLESQNIKEESVFNDNEDSQNTRNIEDNEHLNTTMDTTISNAVDVVNIDDENELIHESLYGFNQPDLELFGGQNQKRKSKTSLTEEQIINITETINAVSAGNIDEYPDYPATSEQYSDNDDIVFMKQNEVVENEVVAAYKLPPLILHETEKIKKKDKKHKRSLDVYNFENEVDESMGGSDDLLKANKKDKKHKKKHKNKDHHNEMEIPKHSSKKKHRDRMSLPDVNLNIPSMITPDNLIVPQIQSENVAAFNYLPTANIQQSSMTMTVTTEIYDAADQLWICPFCRNSDDGRPMIGCDSCDDWYHWSCVGITQEPPSNQQWYCSKCGASDITKRKKKKRKS